MHTNFEELRKLDREAVELSVGLLTAVTAADLSRCTPCEGWDLHDLITHMTAQHRGFAAAAAGRGADPAPWRAVPAGDPIADHRAAAAEVLAAFERAGTAEGDGWTMPEIAPRTIPAEMALGFHLVDYVVHSWDVAAALGVPFEPGVALVEAALPIALAVPGGDQRLAPEFPFRPAVTVPDDAGPLDRLLAALGRDPAWR